MVARIKGGAGLTDDVLKFLKKRADIERGYASDLAKLSKDKALGKFIEDLPG